jgi:hypothetical protein
VKSTAKLANAIRREDEEKLRAIRGSTNKKLSFSSSFSMRIFSMRIFSMTRMKKNE